MKNLAARQRLIRLDNRVRKFGQRHFECLNFGKRGRCTPLCRLWQSTRINTRVPLDGSLCAPSFMERSPCDQKGSADDCLHIKQALKAIDSPTNVADDRTWGLESFKGTLLNQDSGRNERHLNFVNADQYSHRLGELLSLLPPKFRRVRLATLQPKKYKPRTKRQNRSDSLNPRRPIARAQPTLPIGPRRHVIAKHNSEKTEPNTERPYSRTVNFRHSNAPLGSWSPL